VLDLVYPLAPGASDFEELRYSLRSIEANLPGVERVHFFGGKPRWLKTGLHHETKQPNDKWRNARSQMWAAVLNDDLSDPFWWWNDDFHLCERVDDLPLWHGGDFAEWLSALGPRFASSPYMRDAKLTIDVLRKHLWPGHRPLCWSLHTPILVHKTEMVDALTIDESYKHKPHLRTLYGNLAALQGSCSPVHDVKGTAAPPPGQVYASSANHTWNSSPLGKSIRARFTEPSRWER
jgi:hypothetical protein